MLPLVLSSDSHVFEPPVISVLVGSLSAPIGTLLFSGLSIGIESTW
jgi:hypothetical protein